MECTTYELYPVEETSLDCTLTLLTGNVMLPEEFAFRIDCSSDLLVEFEVAFITTVRSTPTLPGKNLSTFTDTNPGSFLNTFVRFPSTKPASFLYSGDSELFRFAFQSLLSFSVQPNTFCFFGMVGYVVVVAKTVDIVLECTSCDNDGLCDEVLE